MVLMGVPSERETTRLESAVIGRKKRTVLLPSPRQIGAFAELV
jgi:hypothetical protein